MFSRSVQFAEAGRLIASSTRRAGFVAPTFRSPPRSRGRDRALRRRADGAVTVAVRITERPFVAVVADMVDGTIAANRLVGAQADFLRNELWVAINASPGALSGPPVDVAIAEPVLGGSVSGIRAA